MFNCTIMELFLYHKEKSDKHKIFCSLLESKFYVSEVVRNQSFSLELVLKQTFDKIYKNEDQYTSPPEYLEQNVKLSVSLQTVQKLCTFFVNNKTILNFKMSEI